jgi:muramoyltetrapeptide carboxypeptidase
VPTPQAQSSIKLLAPVLRPGDAVGIIAPASFVDATKLRAGVQALKDAGYKVEFDSGIESRSLFFAGEDHRRADEFHAMFSRPEIKAIVCARGGYGSNHLLPRLDLSLIRKHPKILIGYSDITSLLTYIHDATGLITFHGPMAAIDFAEDAVEWDSWHSALEGKAEWIFKSSAHAVHPGEAEGVLYGGCLSMLAASIGTPFECRTEGKLLYVEDVNVKPYQLDRMLVQMRFAGKLEGIKGILFGEMPGCVQPGDDSYTLEQVIGAALGDLRIPIGIGFSSGHVNGKNVTLPIGVRARLQVGMTVELKILERATVSEG